MGEQRRLIIELVGEKTLVFWGDQAEVAARKIKGMLKTPSENPTGYVWLKLDDRIIVLFMAKITHISVEGGI